MADRIIPETTALSHFVELADSQGRLVLLPRVMVDTMRTTGQTSIALTINLTAEPQQARPTGFIAETRTTVESPRPWLTVSEAARLHLNDVDGITLAAAKVKISRACQQGKIISTGEGFRRRIDPVSLDAWRLAERERNLADEDY